MVDIRPAALAPGLSGTHAAGPADPRPSLQAMRDTTTTLADGRTLAYTDIGAADAPVVVYCHGAPTSRLDLVGLEDALAALGVRVVTPTVPATAGRAPNPGGRSPAGRPTPPRWPISWAPSASP